MTSRLELLLAAQIADAHLPDPEREYHFDPVRNWRFDFAWPAYHVAAEAEGGTWTHGRHVRGRGFENDCQKYNAAALAGWTVLRFTGGMLDRNEAVPALQQALTSQYRIDVDDAVRLAANVTSDCEAMRRQAERICHDD